MKLLRLKLDVPFRSLPKGFEVQFLRELDHERCFEFHPYCLAGRNGSGKSNVLKALAAIFYHVECIYLNYRPDGFEFDEATSPKGFLAGVCVPDAFELEYCMPLSLRDLESFTFKDLEGFKIADISFAHIAITKETKSNPKICCKNLPFLNEPDGFFSRRRIKDFLPKYIVGYSSGHNEILSLPFFKMRFIHFDEYRDHLIKDVPYDGKPEGRMIYVDDQFSQAILICHFLFPSEAVTKIFEDKIGLKGIRRFRIIIRRHYRVPVAAERLQTMSVEDQKDGRKNTIELTSKLAGHYDEQNQLQLGLIDRLIKCSTAYHEDTTAYADDDECDRVQSAHCA